jgi:hypothetical protein
MAHILCVSAVQTTVAVKATIMVLLLSFPRWIVKALQWKRGFFSSSCIVLYLSWNEWSPAAEHWFDTVDLHLQCRAHGEGDRDAKHCGQFTTLICTSTVQHVNIISCGQIIAGNLLLLLFGSSRISIAIRKCFCTLWNWLHILKKMWSQILNVLSASSSLQTYYIPRLCFQAFQEPYILFYICVHVMVVLFVKHKGTPLFVCNRQLTSMCTAFWNWT